MPRNTTYLMRFSPLFFLVVILFLFSSCTPDHLQSTFDTSGPVAESQLTLFYWIFWAAVVVFVVVVGALLYTVIRYRRKPGDADPEQIHGHTLIEIAWTIIPAIVLAIVAVPTVITIFYNANSPLPTEEGGMTVEVVANQWWWKFTYLNDAANPDDDLVTSNELHIPVGEVVNIKLDSRDVLHSFWIPKLAGKVDIIPNQQNTMWIQADKEGVYLGQCAEFCGVAHALMRFVVVAESKEEFNDWMASQLTPGIVPVEPLALEGMELFESSDAQCWSCHKVRGSKKSRGTKGPDLTHLASRTHIAAGITENTQENLRAWLHDADSIKPGNLMSTGAAIFIDPDKRLSEKQVDALVAYLRNLK